MSRPDYRFWIWPKYRLEYEGRRVELPDSEGELLMILLANQGRRLTRTDLVEARYGHREDGGPMTAADLQRTYVSYLRRRFRKHGINLHIDGFVALGGFVFRGFSLCEAAEEISVPDGSGVMLAKTRGRRAGPSISKSQLTIGEPERVVDPAYRRSAQGRPCDVWGCIEDPATVVGAHLRISLPGLPGAGARKPHDGLIAFMCHLHHDLIDRRVPITEDAYEDLKNRLLAGLLMQRHKASLPRRKPS